MSDILATSEELTKIIERAVNRIGENHALARDNGGVTMNSSEIEEDRKEYRKDSKVIEEALEDAAKDMAEKMVLEQNINSIVKEQVKAMGGGSGFIGNQGTSSSLEKFNKRQEMGEQHDTMEEEEALLKSIYEKLEYGGGDAKSNQLLKKLQKIEKEVREGRLRGSKLDHLLQRLPATLTGGEELRRPFTKAMRLLERHVAEKSEEEVEEATTAGMAGAFVAPLATDTKSKKKNIDEEDEIIDMGGDMIDPKTGELIGIEEQISESTTDTIKKIVRKKLSEAKNVSIPGYEKFEKARKESTKETKAYHKDFEKKFKDYGNFKGNDDPKFPFAEHSKENADGQYQYYRNDEAQDEYVDDWRGMGLEDANGVGDIGRLADYLEGSSETGNAQVDKDGTPLGNVVPNELGEKIKKKINRKKEKIEAQHKAMSNDKRYSPDVQKVKQVKEGVNIDIDNMKKLWSYNKKTQ